LGDCLLWTSLSETAQFLGYVFHKKSYVFILTKKRLGRFLGYFLTITSGHPGIVQVSQIVCIATLTGAAMSIKTSSDACFTYRELKSPLIDSKPRMCSQDKRFQ
jgi:hypothetical protein